MGLVYDSKFSDVVHVSPPFTRFLFTQTSIYAVFSFGSIPLLHVNSPLITLFWIQIYSIVLFTRFFIYVVFPGKQKTLKGRRECTSKHHTASMNYEIDN